MPTINDYLKNVPAAHRTEFERVRSIVKQIVPDTEELISYGMPAFKYKGKPLLYFGSFKHHMSLFPTSGPTEVLKEKLIDFKVSKGTIQFTIDKPLPSTLIEDIVQVRLTEIDTNNLLY